MNIIRIHGCCSASAQLIEEFGQFFVENGHDFVMLCTDVLGEALGMTVLPPSLDMACFNQYISTLGEPGCVLVVAHEARLKFKPNFSISMNAYVERPSYLGMKCILPIAAQKEDYLDLFQYMKSRVCHSNKQRLRLAVHTL